MKKLIFKTIIISACTFIPCSLLAKGLYEKRVEYYKSNWEKIIPRYTKLQYAGSMGMFSFGTGWNYGRDHWETDIWLGLVPRYSDRHAMATFTLKQHYIPWNIPLGKQYSIAPLRCGLYINTLLDRDFWVKNPDKYPKGYYTFSTRVRAHVFVGQSVTLNLNSENKLWKSVSVYYELSTCDLYLISRITNRYLRAKDYLSLGFGIKLQIL